MYLIVSIRIILNPEVIVKDLLYGYCGRSILLIGIVSTDKLLLRVAIEDSMGEWVAEGFVCEPDIGHIA